MESKYIYLGKREGIYLSWGMEATLEKALVDRASWGELLVHPSLITMGIFPSWLHRTEENLQVTAGSGPLPQDYQTSPFATAMILGHSTHFSTLWMKHSRCHSTCLVWGAFEVKLYKKLFVACSSCRKRRPFGREGSVDVKQLEWS